MNLGVPCLKHGYLWTANKESADGPEIKLIFGPSPHNSIGYENCKCFLNN
jgi:hypothetical protein